MTSDSPARYRWCSSSVGTTLNNDGADLLIRSGNLTTVVAWALVVILTAAGSSLTGSLVLCVGSDGHADLELAFEDCCVDDQPKDRDPDLPTRLVDSCGSCSDLDLDSTPLTKQRQRLEAPDPVVVNLPGADTCATSPVTAVSQMAISPPDLISISSVVLLT